MSTPHDTPFDRSAILMCSYTGGDTLDEPVTATIVSRCYGYLRAVPSQIHHSSGTRLNLDIP